ATDTEQLQHAVKAVYGEGFDAQTYLGRFFRRRYSLSESSRFEFVKQMVG
ncbi:P-loop NTPase fold protein, partial [Vibrio parahaemolyticus]